jgi:hypothetical protein
VRARTAVDLHDFAFAIFTWEAWATASRGTQFLQIRPLTGRFARTRALGSLEKNFPFVAWKRIPSRRRGPRNAAIGAYSVWQFNCQFQRAVELRRLALPRGWKPDRSGATLLRVGVRCGSRVDPNGVLLRSGRHSRARLARARFARARLAIARLARRGASRWAAGARWSCNVCDRGIQRPGAVTNRLAVAAAFSSWPPRRRSQL